MVYELVPETDPILHRRVDDFDFANPPVDPVALAADLTETMLKHGAFGIAANQCGLSHRVCIMTGEDRQPFAAFNPEIVASTGERLGAEGCLSFPRLVLHVKRANLVTLVAQDEHGDRFERELTGIFAVGAQHETDHLDGITFTRHVSKLKLDMARKKAR